tara:strand:- start:878 stop:1192 length:315 start_codon:yes stop_codon:yes gene_type:complete
MGDDYTYSISPSEDIAYTGTGATGTFTIDIGDYNDTGSEFIYNQHQVNDLGGKMRERLEAIEARLNILVPDPAKLEKYEALQKAYEHYKTMERLCVEEEGDENV